jgi:hypothetical protein
LLPEHFANSPKVELIFLNAEFKGLLKIGKWTPSGTGICQTGTKRTECPSPFEVLIPSYDWGTSKYDVETITWRNCPPTMVTGSGIFKRMPAQLTRIGVESRRIPAAVLSEAGNPHHTGRYIMSVPGLVENI